MRTALQLIIANDVEEQKMMVYDLFVMRHNIIHFMILYIWTYKAWQDSLGFKHNRYNVKDRPIWKTASRNERLTES